jgi:hypothetical protein
MKKLAAIIGFALLFASCKTTIFEKLPGEQLQQFPASIRGSYYIKWSQGAWLLRRKTDSLYFDITNTRYAARDSAEYFSAELDEAHKLCWVSKKYYVIASRDKDYQQYWNFVVMEPTKRGIKMVWANDNAAMMKYMKRTFLTINNAGDSVFVFKPTDDQLVNYYEKQLRKEALEVFRIKQK